ncbi:MAG: hypothetical protein GY913_22425 [Proteobacteria bacterium]|nr:hypothetical protein [Pseudomonadota bacterium]MCP4919666.1 hypothetical protein [Pseudomonadota bacterium]
MRWSLLLTMMAGLSFSSQAFAQDEDEDEDEIDFTDDTFDLDDFDAEDEEDDIEIERLDEGDDLDASDEPIDDDDYGGDPDGEELDFSDELDELDDDEIGGEGQDNVEIYRSFIDNMDDLGPEEELISWEEYLDEYPNTLFRDRIERRMEEVQDGIYGARIDDGSSGYVDAKDREIGLTNPQMLVGVDPRTKARVSVELGLPAYYAAGVDFEYQLMRELSLHAGYQSRYTGGNLEFGAKYAFIKSARTNLVTTAILDVHYNVDPGFLGVRPQLAGGKIFDVGGGLQVLAQAGVDWEVARLDGAPFGSIRYIGGAHVHYQASDVVGVFAEGSLNIKPSGDPDLANFGFNVVSFGLKFSPPSQPAYIGLNANVPAQYNFWGYHYGAVQADAVWYLDDYLEPAF